MNFNLPGLPITTVPTLHIISAVFGLLQNDGYTYKRKKLLELIPHSCTSFNSINTPCSVWSYLWGSTVPLHAFRFLSTNSFLCSHIQFGGHFVLFPFSPLLLDGNQSSTNKSNAYIKIANLYAFNKSILMQAFGGHFGYDGHFEVFPVIIQNDTGHHSIWHMLLV